MLGGYGHLFDTQFHAHVHDALHDKLEAYEALIANETDHVP